MTEQQKEDARRELRQQLDQAAAVGAIILVSRLIK